MIRVARKEDVGTIKMLIDSLQVTRDHPDWQKKTNGIFEYTKSEEDLLKALNPYFVVAETEEGIRGFSLAYDHNFFRKNYANTKKMEYRYVLENVQGSFLYGDLLGTAGHDTLGGCQHANALLNYGILRARQAGLEKAIAFVCQKPIMNVRCDKWLRHRKFDKLADVPIENGVVLGAYQRLLKF